MSPTSNFKLQIPNRLRFAFFALFLFLFSFPGASAALIHGTVYDLELRTLPNTIVEISSTPKQRMVAANSTYAFTVEKGTYLIRAQHRENATLLVAEERVSITDRDGSYVFDIFLFPSFENEDDLLTDVRIDVERIFPQERAFQSYLIFGGAGILVLLVIFLFYKLAASERRKKTRQQVQPEAAGMAASSEQRNEGIRNTGARNKDAVSFASPASAPDIADIADVPDVVDVPDVPDPFGNQVLKLIARQDGRITQKELRKSLPLSEAKISLVLTDLAAQGKIRKIKKGRGNIIVLST